jgi:RHS repeat-associated protein
MLSSRIGFRVVALVALGAGGWFGCSSEEPTSTPNEPVASIVQHLDPGWNVDGNLQPVAWYLATAGDFDKDNTTNEISKWREHRGNGLDLTQTFGPGKPHYVADGWNATHATVRFDGGDLLSRSAWSLAPTGTDQAFSILAVVRSALQTQNGAVAAWWAQEGHVWAYLKPSSGQLLPELIRTYGSSDTQMYNGPHDLGSGANQRHVIAWRYSPSDHVMKVTLDGTTTSSSAMPAIGPLTSMPFIVGAKSLLPTGMFQGDISELVITNTVLSDAEVQNFTEYARIQWGDLPAQGSADPCVYADGSATPAELEVRCDDGNANTVGDRCAFGSCVGAEPIAGSPRSYVPGPIGWYHAGRSEVTITDDRVARWFDRTSNHRDLMQGFYNGRPTLEPSGWSSTPQNKPTIRFSGGQVMRDNGWTGAVTGDDAQFSVLAVMRAEEDQNVGVASWWNLSGGGRVSCLLNTVGSGCFPELYRSDDNYATQAFADSSDPNMDLQATQHVVVWRFTPEVARFTVDGVTKEVTNATSLGPITPTSFLVGTATNFAPTLFKGHIAELAVIPRSLTDAEVASFRSYAQQEWGGLPYDGEAGDLCTPSAPCMAGLACVAGICSTNHCGNSVKDGDETDEDCGGSCPGCDVSKECDDADDCAAGLDCGENNGACYGRARAKKVCWPTSCADGIGFDECGTETSACGSNCACVIPCDPDNPASVCPDGEVCKRDLGSYFRAGSPHVCLDPEAECPTNNPADCGTRFSKCGATCVCTPDCSIATCADPSGGCPGQVCPGVCDPGQVTPSGGACSTGHAAYFGPDGIQRCRPIICTLVPVVPPLCGTPDAECGEECPICVPECEGRMCGRDPKCQVFCGNETGTCDQGLECDGNGQCAEPTEDSPPTIPSPTGPTPIFDLPDAPTSPVGALAGSFSITEQGTARYTIPIEVPPGRAGMEPALSLVYSGGKSSGDSGIGWHLEGLSKITRCARIQALDGYTAPIKNDPTDVFCVDGKRLNAIAGVYGADGTEYRTIVDSFAKIVSYRGNPTFQESYTWIPPTPRELQGPDWFRIWTKDGRILTYGRTRDSLVTSPSGIRYSWLLNRVEDRVGNNILVNYENSFASVTHAKWTTPTVVRPSSIFYTGRGDASGNRKVVFGYEDRPDPELHYRQGGLASVVAHRLKTVSTAVNGVPARTYRLVYSNEDPASAGDRSQIRQVFECAGAGGPSDVCKPPTTFAYKQEQGFSWHAPGLDLTAGMQLDANGDGVNDFVVTHATINGQSITPELRTALLVTDVALAVVAIPLPTVGAAANLVWGLVKDGFWGPGASEPEIKYERLLLLGTGDRERPTSAIDIVNYPGSTPLPTYLLDYDRDGKDDVAVQSWYNLIVHRSMGDGRFASSPPFGVVTSELPADVFAISPAVYDIDGDSLQDIVQCRGSETLEVRRQLGPTLGFGAPILLTTDDIQTETMPYCRDRIPTRAIFDIDGDGQPDLLAGGNGGSQEGESGWNVLRYSRSSSGAEHLSWQPVVFENVGGSEHGQGLVMGDLNGDGLIDITKALPNTDQVVWLNTGNSEFSRRTLPRPSVAPPGYTRLFSMMYDHDSDGRMDLLEHWRDSYDFRFTQALRPDGWATSFTAHEADDIRMVIETPSGTAEHPGRIRMSADVDGDGNPDLFGDNGVFYGRGKNNTLLEKVTDGLGNLTSIRYDDDAYTYTGECPGGTWPETCAKRLSGLVSGHSEGFIYSATGGGAGQEVYDRVFEYKYENARYHTAGHGWLGFERRIEEFHEDGPLTPASRTTTIEFEPPTRYTPNGTLATDLTEPYLYPLAGMIKRVTVDQAISPDGTPQPLETTATSRRTRIENQWEVGMSVASGSSPGWCPFPKLTARETTVHDRALSAPTEDDGQLLTTLAEIFEVDPFGRVHNHNQHFRLGDGEDYERYSTTTNYTTNEASWLISQPEYHAMHSIRDGHLESRSSNFSYVNGQLTTANYFGPGFTHTTTFNRNAFGNPYAIIESATTEEESRATVITYDTDNIYPATITNALGHVTQLHFDKRWGAPATIIDPNNVVVQHSYDGLGLLATTTDDRGTTTYGYSTATCSTGICVTPPCSDQCETGVGTIQPRVRVSIDRQGPGGSNASSVVHEVDHRGRVVRTVDEGFGGVPVFSEQAFDHRGRVVGTTLPHTADAEIVPSAAYFYDRLDRLIGIQHSDGTSAQRQYASRVTLNSDRAHWLNGVDCGDGSNSCVVDVMLEIDETNRQKGVIVSDHRGLILRSIDGNNVVTAAQTSNYTYGAFGQLTHTRDNLGITRSFNYDNLGRLISAFDPETTAKIYSYNAYDELKTADDASGRLRTYTYDNLGRLRTMVDPAGETTWTYDAGVNAIGRLTSMTSPPTAASPGGQRVDYTYEPVATPNRGLLERVDYVIDGIDYPISYDYDDLGRPSHIAYPDLGTGSAVSVDYHYDSGVLWKLTNGTGSTADVLWQMTAAFQGHLVGTELLGSGVSTTYDYTDHQHWLKSIHTQRGAADIQKLTYTHTNTGQVFTRTNGVSQRQVTYDYDPLDRLILTTDAAEGGGGTPIVTQFGYDDVGNLTLRGGTVIAYEPGGSHHIETVGANAYDYTVDGNMSFRSGPDVPGESQFITYTSFDLPSTIFTGSGPEAQVTQFEYSADEERLVRRDLDGTRHFVGGLYQRLADPSGTTEEERFRLHAGGRLIGEIVRQGGNDKTHFFHPDHLGSPHAVTTTGESTVVTHEFGPFGEELSGPSTELTRAGFTGHDHDRSLGLIDMKGRVYDPLAGSFLTADPILQAPFFSQGLNRYAYVFNDPINNTDPSGFAVMGCDFACLQPSPPSGGVDLGSIDWGSIGELGANASPVASIGSGVGYGINNVTTTLSIPTQSTTTTVRIGPSGSKAPTTGMPSQGGGSAVGNSNGIVGPPTRPKDTSQWLAGEGAGGPGTPYLPNADRKPPGWTEDWKEGVDKWGPYSEDPSGVRWHPHPEDEGHWDHYDNDRGGRFPEKSVKPFPGQKRMGPNRSPTDPWPPVLQTPKPMRLTPGPPVKPTSVPTVIITTVGGLLYLLVLLVAG